MTPINKPVTKPVTKPAMNHSGSGMMMTLGAPGADADDDVEAGVPVWAQAGRPDIKKMAPLCVMIRLFTFDLRLIS